MRFGVQGGMLLLSLLIQTGMGSWCGLWGDYVVWWLWHEHMVVRWLWHQHMVVRWLWHELWLWHERWLWHEHFQRV